MRKALLISMFLAPLLLVGSRAMPAAAGGGRQIDRPRAVQTAAAPSLATTTAPATTASVASAAVSTDVNRPGWVGSTATVYPSPDAAVTGLGQLQAGSKVTVTRALGGWYEIVYLDGPGSHAWLRQEAVRFDDAPAVMPTAVPATATPAPAPAAANTPMPTAKAAPAGSGLSGTLVFQDSNGGTIYIYDLRSKALRRLTTGMDPALSPDGQTVAFIRGGGEQGLYLISADGTNERRIYGGSRDLRTPGWSPDGQYVVFSRVNGEEKCRQVGPRCVPDRPGLEKFPLVTLDKRDLSRVNRDGGDFRDISTMETAISPDWNAAGIVYAVGEGLQITADQNNVASRPLLDARNYNTQDPSWQPSGGRILFQKKDGTHWEIYAINPDGSGLQALTRPVSVLVDELPQNVSPAWSPNGRSIVYLSNREADGSAGKWRIWVMDADGGNQRPLDPDVLGNIEFRYDNSADQVIDWS